MSVPQSPGITNGWSKTVIISTNVEDDWGEADVTAGILHHSLETKPAKLPVKVEHQIVYRDSLVYKDRIETKTVEVPRLLTWWQKAKMKLGVAFLILIVILLLYLILKFSNLLNLKRL